MIHGLISERILAAYEEKNELIIAFCGAADLGKSYLAGQVVQELRNSNVSSSHLTLDSFLMDRSLRQKNNLSGYDIEAHDIELIASTIKKWKSGRDIFIQAYDHHTGAKSIDFKRIKKSPVLIIDGLFALNDHILPMIDLSFFIHTNPEKLKLIKLEADLIKRGYSPQYAEDIYDQEFDLYKRNIEPFKKKADIELYLKDKWVYEMDA